MPDDTTPPAGGNTPPADTPPATPKLGAESPPPPATKTAEPVYDATAYHKFRETLPADMKEHQFFVNAKDFGDLAKQAFNAHRLVGTDKIPAPREDWKQEDWDGFYNRLGRPETPDKYGDLPKPEGTGELPIDTEQLKAWDDRFHKLGLTKKQRDAILEDYVGQTADLIKGEQERLQGVIQQELNGLRGEWGEEYDTKLALANEAMDRFAPESLKQLLASGDPVAQRLANSRAVIELFEKIGSQMIEDYAKTGDGKPIFTVGSPEQARAELVKFQQEHRDILFRDPYSLRPDERQRREDLLVRQRQLYEKAYPED